MNRRLRYPIFIIVTLLIIHFLIQPYLYHFFESNKILEIEYRLYYLSFNLLVTIGIAIIIYIEGKYNSGVQAVSIFLVLNALMDFTRFNVYPDISIISGVVSMFGGVFIFGFGLVTTKKAIFKKGAGIFFILIGLFYLLRFPMFIDTLFFYLKKYGQPSSAADSYYFGTLYLNYVIIILELIALDAIILENIAMSRYTKLNE